MTNSESRSEAVELFGVPGEDGRLAYFAHSDGIRGIDFRSGVGIAQIASTVKAAYGELNAELSKWPDGDPGDDGACRARLEVVTRRWGARLALEMLDDTGRRVISNFLSSKSVLTVLGDCVSRLPWELAYLQGSGDKFISDLALVARIAYSAPGLGTGSNTIDMSRRKRLASRSLVTLLDGLGYEAVDGVEELHSQIADQQKISICCKASKDGTTLLLADAASSLDFDLLCCDAYRFQERSLIFLLACGAEEPEDHLERNALASKLAASSGCTVVAFSALLPESQVRRFAEALIRILNAEPSQALHSVLRLWIEDLAPLGRLFRLHGAWNSTLVSRE